jgi:hypothetical protein
MILIRRAIPRCAYIIHVKIYISTLTGESVECKHLDSAGKTLGPDQRIQDDRHRH